MLAGIPIGVAYAHDPAITVAITTALGSALRLSASDTAIGTISAVVAVLDMKFVSTHVTTNITSKRTIGLGLEPIIPTILSAISIPAPVFSRALASASEPPNNSTTFKSIDFSASFSDITPARTSITAPRHAETCILIPILSSNIMARITRINTISDIACFHFGTLLKSFVCSVASSVITFLSGRSLQPITTK